MSLNKDKCAVISFSLKKNVFIFDYKLNDPSMSGRNIIKDLFDYLIQNSLNHHIDYIRNKAFIKLGFLKRMCIDFKDESILRTLYFSLVWSHFDYASLIWHTDYITQNQSISSVQNNCIRYLSYKYHLERVPLSGYGIPCSLFRIMPLDKRINLLNCKFLYKLLLNIINCPELLEHLNFRISQPCSRNKSLFDIYFK